MSTRHDQLTVVFAFDFSIDATLWSNSLARSRAGVESPVTLTRAGWAGMQSTGAVLWSSDIPSTFESLQVQVRAGLSTMMSGIPWWYAAAASTFCL